MLINNFHNFKTFTKIIINIVIQLLYGFRIWMARSKHAGMLRESRKARETRAEGE
jgi:hypothetical protein